MYILSQTEIDALLASLCSPPTPKNRKERQREQFETLARPLIKWLNDNYHPHAKIIIDPTSAEVVSGEQVFHTEEYILD